MTGLFRFLPRDYSIARLHSAALAVVQWLQGVCHVRVLCQNSQRYDHCCYGMRIGNRTQAFEWKAYQLS